MTANGFPTKSNIFLFIYFFPPHTVDADIYDQSRCCRRRASNGLTKNQSM